MFRTLIAALVTATALTIPAFAQNDKTVKDVVVEVDLAAVTNPQAAAYWATLADDLKGAILAQITDQIDENGIKVSVDITEVELSNGFQETLGLADTRLSGTVRMTTDSGTARVGSYKLSVDVNQVLPLLPAGTDLTVVTADTKAYYDAMIKVFATNVVERLI